jgi:hypothetical protein
LSYIQAFGHRRLLLAMFIGLNYVIALTILRSGASISAPKTETHYQGW